MNLKIYFVLAIILFGLCGPAHTQNSNEFQGDAEDGFYYTIQEGDTLWDLSQKFYQSQWDWPGLWEMNRDIKNPHQIYPGKKIRVYLKPTASQPEPMEEKPPEPAQARSVEPINPTFSFSEINHVGFIREKEQEAIGTIIREQDGNLMMSADDIIYIAPLVKDAFTPGKMYQVYATQPVNERFHKERFKGIKHLIKADIQVLESNESYVTAVIKDSYRDANVGDRIMPLFTRDSRLPVDDTPAPLDAFIIGSEDDTAMVNDYSIAFINRGKSHQVRPGQIYSILQDNKSAFDATDSSWRPTKTTNVELDPLTSGKLIILHAEDAASTVMILSSKRDIHPGDMVN